MQRLAHTKSNRTRRKSRIRATVSGVSARPRLTVHISRLHVSAQLVDDSKGHTVAAVSTVGAKKEGSLTDQATWVGSEIAKLAKSAKVKQVVFDRNGKLYHGRIKALAEAARAGGLEF